MLLLMCAAAAVLMVTMGMRQSLGLYIAPIIESTHVGYAAMSFALAVGQLMWGVAQPVFGALADRHGSRPVLIAGALLLAGGTALTPFATRIRLSRRGVLTAAGAGAGSFSVLIGVRAACARRQTIAGRDFVNAGGSLGCRPAPLTQCSSIVRLDGGHGRMAVQR
jgi:MFS family permease